MVNSGRSCVPEEFKVTAMSAKLPVLVHVDLDGPSVTIKVTGALTDISQQGLSSLIGRAYVLLPGIRVIVDLSRLSRAETNGIRLLDNAVTDLERTGRGGHVHLVLPGPAPTVLSDAHSLAVPRSAPEKVVQIRPVCSSIPSVEAAA